MGKCETETIQAYSLAYSELLELLTQISYTWTSMRWPTYYYMATLAKRFNDPLML